MQKKGKSHKKGGRLFSKQFGSNIKRKPPKKVLRLVFWADSIILTCKLGLENDEDEEWVVQNFSGGFGHRCCSGLMYQMCKMNCSENFHSLYSLNYLQHSISLRLICGRYDAGEEIDLSIPFYVMGSLATACVYLNLLLPETSHSAYPTTLEEALALKDPK